MKKHLAVFFVLTFISIISIHLRLKIPFILNIPTIISTKIQIFASDIRKEGEVAVKSVIEASRLIDENEKLKIENLKLKTELAKMKYIKRENEKLRVLLKIKKYIKQKSIGARVVSWTGDYWQLKFIIDKGKKDKVREGMAVIGAKGIVGIVVKVMDNYCIAISNVDPRFSVHVEDLRSQIRGILRGTGDGMRLDYIKPDMDVKPGDTLFSTGIGGIFPAGIIIGKVISVKKSQENRFAEIKVKPTDRLENNRYVILTGGIVE